MGRNDHLYHEDRLGKGQTSDQSQFGEDETSYVLSLFNVAARSHRASFPDHRPCCLAEAALDTAPTGKD